MFKLAAIIVWFNPKSIIGNPIENINSYLSYIDKLYIIDNSSDSNEDIAQTIQKSTYVLNRNIGGLGGAQNIGLKLALEDGFEYAMTMDQDSKFEPGEFEKYKQLVQAYVEKNENAVSFAPLSVNENERLPILKRIRFKILSPLKKLVYGKDYKPHIIECESKDKVIASANIIKLSAWEKVGKFNEELFISEIDYDFCYRLKNAGYDIIRFNTIHLKQQGGSKHGFLIFPKYTAKYSDDRFYYIVRNAYIMKSNYPEKTRYYKTLLKHLFIDYCLNSIHPIRHFKIFKKAKLDSETFKMKLPAASVGELAPVEIKNYKEM